MEGYNEVIEVYPNFEGFADEFHFDSDTTYVLNFWSTTCPPCLKEMPHFEAIGQKYEGKPLKVYLISLDRLQDYGRIAPFVTKHHIENEVVHLQDENYSAWLDFIDPSWYGALPATLIKKKKEKLFKFGAYADLNSLQADIIRVYNNP